MKQSITKIISLLIIVGLNWAGLSAVIETVAYYFDNEDAANNIFTASTLDFSLDQPPDFSPEVTPTATSSRNINISNIGILGFQYTVQTTNVTGSLCDYLDLAADLDGISTSTSLTSFNYNAGEFSSSTNNWQFTVTLRSNDPGLENETCNFDFVFDGVQIGGVGFSDQEIISNTIDSGSWVQPTPPTTSGYSPIADSYVNEKSPNSNYGSDKELEIRSKNCPNPLENERTFIKFDFNFPSGTVINSAILKLYMKDAPSSPRIYEAKRVLEVWKERDSGPGDGIDWDNQPGVDGLTALANSGNSTPKWLSWDVTSDMQAFVNGTYSNYGWRLNDSVESEHNPFEGKFASRENNDVDKRPVLEITFILPEITTTYPVINEVYYHVGSGKGNDPKNEWVEIYNPTDSGINISGWKICDGQSCDTIPASTPIPAKGFAVITDKASTWDKWSSIPSEAIKIVLVSAIGNGLANAGDRVILKNASEEVIDAMSYGNDTTYFELPLSGKGKSLARIIKGYDTNSATDWIINATPNPGTNPSVDGVETLIFTSYGVAVAGYEPVIEEDDSGEEEIFEDEPIIEEESTEEEVTTEENQEQGGIIEEINEIIDGVIDKIVDEIMPDEETGDEVVSEPEAPVIEDTLIIEEAPADDTPVVEEQPVVVPENTVVEGVAPSDGATE
jgi:hypothetical protein